MDIDELQAGSKLDILMAEMMGTKAYPYSANDQEGWSCNIIDWLVEQGYMITVYTGQYRDQGVKARCCILRAGDLATSDGVDAIANKRPLAICRAALKARERWGE